MIERGQIDRRRFIGGTVAGALGAASVAGLGRFGGLSSAGAAVGPATLTIDLSSTIGAIPARMLGFSMERSRLCQPLLSPDNEPMKALFGLLGPGVLRLGGNSVEAVGWNPLGPGLTPGTVAPADLDRLAAFLDEVDWHVLYGTPFVTGTAAGVADEALAVSERLGARLVGFELANEPDLYPFHPEDAAVGTLDLFLARWEAYATAIHAAVPGAVFAGPANALIVTHTGWPQRFADRESATAAILTQHYYRGFGLPPGSITELLAPDTRLEDALTLLQSTAEGHGMTWRLAETNSYASGGQPGVSNTLASALWVPQLYSTAARHRAAGVNIHNSGNGEGYPAIAQLDGVVTGIRPLFYGLLALARAGTGDVVATEISPASAELRAFAVRRSATALAIVLVNTAADEQDVQIDVGHAVLSAVGTTVAGPRLDATAGVTYRGAAVGIDGSWSPEDPVTLAVSGHGVDVTAAATSITVIEVTLTAPPPAPTSTTSTSTSTATPTTTTATAAAAAAAAAAPAAAQPVSASPAFTG